MSGRNVVAPPAVHDVERPAWAAAASAFVDALVLTALTDAGLAAVRVAHFKGVDGQTVLGLGRLAAAGVFDPARANDCVYLVIGGSPLTSVHTTYIAYGVNEYEPVDLSKPYKQIKSNQDVRLAPHTTWSVVLNLTEVFRPLKGFVTVSNSHGFVKVELAGGESE